MAKKQIEYDRTAFIAKINGQYKIARNHLPKVIGRSDRSYFMGNMVGFNEYASDHNSDTPNQNTITTINLMRQTYDVTLLAGPNEMACLHYPDEYTSDTTIEILSHWWFAKNNVLKVAAADRGRLISHGGLTYLAWKEIGSPKTAEQAAELINEKYGKSERHTSAYQLGFAPSYRASPVWADPLMETYPSWITSGEAMPFPQIHSRTSLSSFVGRKKMNDEVDPLYFLEKKKLYPTFGSTATISGKQMTAIDLDIGDKILTSIPKPKNFFIEKRVKD